MPFVEVCEKGELTPGQMKGVEVDDQYVMVVNDAGTYRALNGICTHERAELDEGFYLAGRVTCPLHSSQFDLESGECLSPPATESLDVYEVKVEDDTVFVKVEAT